MSQGKSPSIHVNQSRTYLFKHEPFVYVVTLFHSAKLATDEIVRVEVISNLILAKMRGLGDDLTVPAKTTCMIVVIDIINSMMVLHVHMGNFRFYRFKRVHINKVHNNVCMGCT